MPDKTNPHVPTRYGFLLVQEYSMMAFTAAVDQIRMANRLSGKLLYEWVVISDEGLPITASNDLTLETAALRDAGRLDAVFVCGGVNIEKHGNKTRNIWLRDQASRKVSIGAICTGTLILAEANLLQDCRCTIHWENMTALQGTFPGTGDQPRFV